MRQRLRALSAEDPWWEECLAAEELASPARPASPRRWLGAWCGVTALHLVAIGMLSLWHRDGIDAPSPGTGAPSFEVVMLPAWPEPGHHQSQLGASSLAASSKRSVAVIAPPTPLTASSPAADRISEQISPQAPPAVDTPLKSAVIAPAPEASAAPQADLPPSTPSAAETLWEGNLLAKLSSLKRYPPSALHAGLQDTVMVRFVVDRSGQALSAEVIRSKGVAILDREALALIRRASPLPAPPPEVLGDAIELIAPIQFILHLGLASHDHE